MTEQRLFKLHRYDFNQSVIASFHDNHYAKTLWPIVYIISDEKIKEVYIGETADVYTRMGDHLKSDAKKKLTCLRLITSEKFNKSATLDIESNLIKYVAGDGEYKLLNANVGLANHNYFQKDEVYLDIFKSIWVALKDEGLVRHPLEYIDNSDLFKYSPYKTLNADQRRGLMSMMRSLLDNNTKTTLIEGGAGTGKSILAIFLFKLLNTDLADISLKEFGDDETEFIELVYSLKNRYPKPKMALVVPMSSFRSTLQKVFGKVKGLSANMVMGPSHVADEQYDILVVDEAHRLRQRVNLGSYFRDFDKVSIKLGFDKSKNTELDWVLKQGNKVMLFYDEYQSIKPSDVEPADFEKLKSQTSTSLQKLKSQLRVKGGVDYVDYVHKLMNCSFRAGEKLFAAKKYSFLLFDSLEEMVSEIKQRDKESGLSRLIAGFSWPWISKENKELFDINIGNVSLQWNGVTVDWIHTDNAINEVGCIHTSQGYDLNYAGIIFGKEISYDEKTNEIVVVKDNYFDRNGKAGIKDLNRLKKYIVNIYTTILQRGIHGTYVYACDDALRTYLAKHIPMAKKAQELKSLDSYITTAEQDDGLNTVRFYDIKAAASGFSPDQIANEKRIKLPSGIKATKNMFACQVVGESMNLKIPNGAICLFKEDEGGSRNGKIVLVQHGRIQDRDYGDGVTVKLYKSEIKVEDDEWYHESITLHPMSDDSSYQPIELRKDELRDLKVIGIFDRVLYNLY
jgi:DUF2075 family protein/predicted GIY-YIG superfamily endonuclease/SOS-response transcriptional repressor LexA